MNSFLTSRPRAARAAFLSALLSSVSFAAFGQSSPNFTNGQVPTVSQWNGYFASKIDATNGTANGLNNTGAYQFNGQNALSLTSASNEPAMKLGPYAGASLPPGAQFWFANGPYAFESASGSLGECLAEGPGAGISLTTGCGLFIGTSAGASITTQSNSLAVGGDAMRNYWDTAGGLAIGPGALQDGVGTNNIGIGGLALAGAYATITFAGTPHAGDTWTVNITSTNTCATGTSPNCTVGVPVSYSYTEQSGDNLAAIATGLMNAMNAPGGATGINYNLGDGVRQNSHNVFALGAQIANGNSNVIKLHTPANWQLSFSMSCSGSGCGSETATVGAGFTGSNNIVIAPQGLSSPLLTNPQDNVIIGENTATGTSATNPIGNVLLGDGIAPNITFANNNTVTGQSAGAAINQADNNVISGWFAGSVLTYGSNNLIQGEKVASTTLQTGSNNILEGTSSAVDTPAANTSNYMNLGNAHIENMTAPTIASGFGTSPSVVAGASTEAFTVNVGTGGSANNGTITMGANAAPNGWQCNVVDMTNPATADTIAVPVNSTTIKLLNYSRTSGAATAWAASDVLAIGPCVAY